MWYVIRPGACVYNAYSVHIYNVVLDNNYACIHNTMHSIATFRAYVTEWQAWVAWGRVITKKGKTCNRGPVVMYIIGSPGNQYD